MILKSDKSQEFQQALHVNGSTKVPVLDYYNAAVETALVGEFMLNTNSDVDSLLDQGIYFAIYEGIWDLLVPPVSVIA